MLLSIHEEHKMETEFFFVFIYIFEIRNKKEGSKPKITYSLPLYGWMHSLVMALKTVSQSIAHCQAVQSDWRNSDLDFHTTLVY